MCEGREIGGIQVPRTKRSAFVFEVFRDTALMWRKSSDHALDPVPKDSYVEADDESKAHVSGFQVGKQFCLVNWRNRVDGF